MSCGKQGRLPMRRPRGLIWLLLGAIWCGALMMAGGVGAATQARQPLVIGNDRGGMVLDRLREIRRLRLSGQPVEIRGRICFSTCTMYLGLPQTCISPQTVFGFHGPTRQGRPMPPDDFDYVSRVIAHYYPEALRHWYLEKARHRVVPIYRVKAAVIIRMGIPACQS